ncbi:MAG: TetR/AcrR family transcriptional regulator [Acidimicrobiales bacterium]
MPDRGSDEASRLSLARIIDAAMAVADETGIERLTIRRLAQALDTKPMSLYHHVAGKEAIVDAMVDRVFAEIDPPPADLDWRSAIRLRCCSAREVLARHPWATPLMESRTTPGPATLAHHDAVLGCLRRGGLSLELTAHAYALLDAYVYGFALQAASLPATSGTEMVDLAESIIEPLAADAYPYLTELTTDHVLQPGYDFQAEFDFGLDLILDGLEQQR